MQLDDTPASRRRPVNLTVAGCRQDAQHAGDRRSGQRPPGGSPAPRRAIARREGRRADSRGLRVVRLRGRPGGRQEHLDPPAAPVVLRSAHGKDRGRRGGRGPDGPRPLRRATPRRDRVHGRRRSRQRRQRRRRRRPAARGHGRNGADAYRGAERIDVPHPSLTRRRRLSRLRRGTVYDKAPGVVVRITGQPPLAAKIYQLQKLRCHLCGQVFTAVAPAEAGDRKYDATAGSMIGLLKYGSGLPFNRLDGLQGNLEVPLPASTQWDIVEAVAENLAPAFEELIRQAAQGEVLHNDDTTVKILELMGERPAKVLAGAKRRTMPTSAPGLFTSGVVALRDGHRVALFFSGRRHAGENLAEVLKHRAEELPPPIQMCDALSRNLPGELQTILANCLAHARRQFVDVYDRFPEQCRHLLEALAVVYRNDAMARERRLSPEARLQFHQEASEPTMQATARLAARGNWTRS